MPTTPLTRAQRRAHLEPAMPITNANRPSHPANARQPGARTCNELGACQSRTPSCNANQCHQGRTPCPVPQACHLAEPAPQHPTTRRVPPDFARGDGYQPLIDDPATPKEIAAVVIAIGAACGAVAAIAWAAVRGGF